MRRVRGIVPTFAVLLALAPTTARAASPEPLPSASATGRSQAYRCQVVTKAKPKGPVTTPHGSARVDPLPLVVGIPRLRCTGQNPQDPHGIGGQGGGNGNGAVGNGDGHIPFTGFPLDESLAAALVLVSCGALLVTASRTRQRVV